MRLTYIYLPQKKKKKVLGIFSIEPNRFLFIPQHSKPPEGHQIMLTEQVILGTQRSSLDNSSVSTAESSIAVFDLHTYSQTASFKRSSTPKNCLAVTPSHVFAAQSDKAIINIYNRSKQNLESTVPFQEKFTVIEASGGSGAFLAGGTDSGRLTIWEVCVILRTSNGLPKSLFRKKS